MKKWYDDWKVTHNLEGDGVWTVELPNSKAKEKKIIIRGASKHVGWLISFLELALMTLTDNDKKESPTETRGPLK